MNNIKVKSCNIEESYDENGNNAFVVEIEKNDKKYTLVEWINYDNELEEIESHLRINQIDEITEIFGEYIYNDEEWMTAWNGDFSDEAISDFAYKTARNFMHDLFLVMQLKNDVKNYSLVTSRLEEDYLLAMSRLKEKNNRVSFDEIKRLVEM